jgi:8-oxo-dGTP pyrophosphatase MutT (NUDIX family)
MDMQTTYDGEPIAQDPPHGAATVVTCQTPEGTRYLILHRAHQGPEFEGDWAWTPPSGCRKPGEDVTAGAVRELLEETGLRATPRAVLIEDTAWAVFHLEVAHETEITLDGEHDRYAWVDYAEALRRCGPETVRDNLRLIQARLS